MNTIKIKFLLPALFGMIVLMLVVQGALGMRSVWQLNDQAGNISNRMDKTLLIADMDRDLSNVRRLYLMVSLASNTDEKKTALTSLKEAITTSSASSSFP